MLERRRGCLSRGGNVARLEYVQSAVGDALEPYAVDELDMIAVRYTPRVADLIPQSGADTTLGPAAWTGYLAFDHTHPALGSVEFRRALAHAIDRDALAALAPRNLVIATGGLVPPALQGHTPDIAPRFEPERARAHLDRSGHGDSEVDVAALDEWVAIAEAIVSSWRDVLGVRATIRMYTVAEAMSQRPLELPADAPPWTDAAVTAAGWLPGYPDPEYYLRLLLHSDSKTNEGGFGHPPFDELIERARKGRSDRERLELFHEADRMAVADQVALIPIAYGRSMAFVKPWVGGWWEFGKTSASFADLVVGEASPRA